MRKVDIIILKTIEKIKMNMTKTLVINLYYITLKLCVYSFIKQLLVVCMSVGKIFSIYRKW